MAVGDPNDILKDVVSVLPPGWFTESGASTGTAQSKTPIRDMVLAGVASVGSWAYSLFQGVQGQTRIATATGGWLDIASTDLFAGALPRVAGESDAAFRARIKANLFAKADTRAAIQNALAVLTGKPVRMMEPWAPADTAVWDRAYYDVDTAAAPGQYADASMRYQGFIQCVLPAVTGPNSIPIGSTLDGLGFYDSSSYGWDAPSPALAGATLIYNLVNRLKVYGTKIWVQFVTAT